MSRFLAGPSSCFRACRLRRATVNARERRVRRIQQVASVALRRLVQIDNAEELRDLASPPANRLEALKGDRKGQYSIRINDRYRICFRWTEAGAADVDIVDYH